MMRMIAPALLLLAAGPAMAHVGPGAHGSVATGLLHPLSGLDHILAMVAVGLWASLIGGRALWIAPAAFVGAMVAGYALGVAGLPLPMVEPMILASTVVLGLAAAAALRIGLVPAAAAIAAFGLFHGHAHGGELGEAGALRFGLGFVLATAMLHLAGIGLGLGLKQVSARHGNTIARIAGGVIALAGLSLALG
ncbi:HupE/UreJ family protein [Mangrovicoccus algicola]|uniref:HupE/UreJ family protein n=1 Tax=Mangrovicoccus algicola TaxID=2771008 RepID=A0A8J6ZFJ9_9RHOB|nr:HupE/UreJ family protein [Mangrovicoccus algicola]MBE3640571.1 HupE/UreJ family protein [Mangrovicoccus algicola]